MLGVRLDQETERRLSQLAKLTGRSKSHYAKIAIQQFLDEREDYLLAIARLENESDPIISEEEMRRRLGMDA